ncbi:MAG: hypothetical protein LBL15_07990 [Oscillospiraceae bacterium]|jgi:hypothetical protein|nr:hypothetical protein [Oscillospiraceae bacterium]
MVKKWVYGAIKAAFFMLTFIAYWFCLDEKYYRYQDTKIKARVSAAAEKHRAQTAR